jgi:signal transduction histidine kinase
MFNRLRGQLTLWYVGVLALTLIGVGAVVHVLVARSLDGQINDSLRTVNDQAAAVLSRPSPSAEELEEPGEHEHDDDYLGVLSAVQFESAGDVALLVLDAQGVIIANPRNLDTANLPLDTSGANDFHNASIDGSQVRLLMTSVQGDDGTPAGYVVTIKPLAQRDQDLRRLLELFLIGGGGGLIFAAVGGLGIAQVAIRPVRAAFQRQREFIADASHELRTPLAVVRANAEEMLTRARPEDREPLTDIVAETGLMARLVSDLLTLAQADRAQLELHRAEVDLLDLVLGVARGTRQLAAERSVNVTASGERMTVRADADRMRELLFVLLDNAVRYTPAGGSVTIETRPGRDSAEIFVEDTGVGIPEEDIPHVFERFYRVDKARSRAEGGLGLGLAIAQAIVSAHGGSIEIASRPGKGTRVRVTLPRLRTTGIASPSEQPAAGPAQ